MTFEAFLVVKCVEYFQMNCRVIINVSDICFGFINSGAHSGIVVKALRYKLAGCGFDS